MRGAEIALGQASIASMAPCAVRNFLRLLCLLDELADGDLWRNFDAQTMAAMIKSRVNPHGILHSLHTPRKRTMAPARVLFRGVYRLAPATVNAVARPNVGGLVRSFGKQQGLAKRRGNYALSAQVFPSEHAAGWSHRRQRDDMVMTQEPQGGSPSGMLDKALLVLNEILAGHGARSLAGASQKLGIPLSTMHRLVATFERHGFLIRAGRGHFVPGITLMRLGTSSHLNEVLAQIGRPLLKKLARQTGHAAHLGVLEGDMVTYLVKEALPKTHLFTREAMQLEAYCSGIGKVLLASLSTEARDRYMASGPFVPLTANTITDADALRAELGMVGVSGYAIDNAEIADRLRCVAVPLRHDCAVIAALSLSCVADILEPSFVKNGLAALRDCARQIEAKLVPALAGPTATCTPRVDSPAEQV